MEVLPMKAQVVYESMFGNTMIVGEPEHAVRSIPVTVPNGHPKPVKKS
jgi:hypothetical protein